MIPYINYTEKELQDDILMLQENQKWSVKKCKVSNHFFQRQRMTTISHNGYSPEYLYEKNKIKMDTFIDKRKGIPLTSVEFLTKACAQFPSSIAISVYRKYQVKHVFDPYAGWGDRCLASMICNIKYTGCDTNLNLIEPYRLMIEYIKPLQIPIIHFVKSESVQISDDTDLIFTSPPFYHKKNNKITERYPYCETDYDTFMRESLIPLFKNRIRKILHLPLNMYANICEHVRPADSQMTFGRNQILYEWTT